MKLPNLKLNLEQELQNKDIKLACRMQSTLFGRTIGYSYLISFPRTSFFSWEGHGGDSIYAYDFQTNQPQQGNPYSS